MTQVEMMLHGEHIYVELCKFIVAIHKDNMIIYEESKRNSFQEDINYQNKLCGQVIECIKLRMYGLQNVSKYSIESYVPQLYYINVLNNFLIEKHMDIRCNSHLKLNKDIVTIFKIEFENRILNRIKACMILMDNHLIEESFATLRMIIELYMNYIVIIKSPNVEEVINEYNVFLKYQIDYKNKEIISQDVTNKFNERKIKNKRNFSIIDFLNYGWLDSIKIFSDSNDKRYKLKDISNIINNIYQNIQPNIGDVFWSYYKKCNTFIHAFVGKSLLFSCRLNILYILNYMLDFISHDIIKDYRIGCIIDSVDIISEFRKVSLEFVDKYEYICNDKELEKKLNDEYF